MQTWVSKFKMAAHVWSCVECVMSHVMADQEEIKVIACLVFYWHYAAESHATLLKKIPNKEWEGYSCLTEMATANLRKT